MRRIITVILIAALAVFSVLLLQREILPPENIDIAATQQGEHLLIKGRLVQGNETYRGYTITYEGDKLLLSISGSRLPIYPKEFDIQLPIPKDGIKEVYLTGKNGERLLAWQAETPVMPPSTPAPKLTESEIHSTLQ